MITQREFEDVATWLTAVAEGRAVAIMPSSLASEALDESANALTKKLKNGAIPAIVIGGRSFISADFVNDELVKRRQVLDCVQKNVERVARRRGKIFYGELMEAVGMSWQNPPDRSKIGVLLGELSRWSYKKHGVFLSSIVHRKTPDPTSPGPGYMTLVENIAREYENVDFDPNEDESTMLQRHMEAVWDHYARN